MDDILKGDDRLLPDSLGALFNPASIAVVGASRHRDKIGNLVFLIAVALLVLYARKPSL